MKSLGAVSTGQWLVAVGVVAAATAGVAVPLGVFSSTGSATPSADRAVTGSSGTASSNGTGNNGNGNGGEPPAKNFTITGVPSGELFPGVQRHVTVSIDNPNNQAIRLYNLQVSITGVTKEAGRTGTCPATSMNVVVGTWTGGSFVLAKNSPATVVPGYIPLTLTLNAPDACQGATFSLAYTGQAEKA